MEKQITPEQCTKEELVWWVRQYKVQLLFRYFSSDIRWRRTEVLLNEMSKITAEQYKLMQLRNELSEPYQGKPIKEIPDNVFNQIAELEIQIVDLSQRYERLDRKYRKLNAEE